MMKGLGWLLAALACAALARTPVRAEEVKMGTVPMILDHNRMLLDAEVQRKDGTWRKARLWVDSGNPDQLMTEEFARDLGIDFSAAPPASPEGRRPSFEVPAPTGVRLGGMPLDFAGVKTKVAFQPRWMYHTMHHDATIPSTVLMRYSVIFDYPKREVTIAQPGTTKPRGIRAPAAVNPKTGILQIDALVGGDSLSLALDNGASYSFISEDVFQRLAQKHPDWPQHIGGIGCANIWGWWPGEPAWPVMRVPEISWGSVPLAGVGLVATPNFFGGASLGAWYSQKAARAVDGFLGPNAYKAYRVEIDYPGSAVYFEKGAEPDIHDMDVVGITVQPEEDGSYQVIGVAERDGKPILDQIQADDTLLQIDDLKVTGCTMGTVVDALRGKPGDVKRLLLDHKGTQYKVEAKVERFL
jgi:hypothetical protein